MTYVACAVFLGVISLRAQTASPSSGEDEALPRYMIQRFQLPAGAGGIQAAVSRGFAIVNFGSRDGVRPGSVFNVRRRHVLVARVRVDQVWRDSARVSILKLSRKPDRTAPYPLQPGYLLDPHYVLVETIQFRHGEPTIEPDMHERLHYAARFIRAYPHAPLIVEGHTDSTGSAAANLKLSMQRAERIRSYLHDIHGIPADRIHVKGYGETDPIASNATPWGRAQNRRVDIILADHVPQ